MDEKLKGCSKVLFRYFFGGILDFIWFVIRYLFCLLILTPIMMVIMLFSIIGGTASFLAVANTWNYILSKIWYER